MSNASSIFSKKYWSDCERGYVGSSRPEVLCKKGVLKIFTKFTGKHLCQSLLFNKIAGLRPTILLKKRLWDRCFPVNFVRFPRAPFFIEHFWWLLLICPWQKPFRFSKIQFYKNTHDIIRKKMFC